MIIKNLTSEVLSLRVKELLADCSYDLTIQAKGFTEIDRAMEIVQLSSLLRERKVEIVSGLVTPREIIKEVSIDVSDPVQPQEDEKADTVDEPQEDEKADTVETSQPETSTYICDICGAEFASARGLSSHKKKTHEE